jgi:thiol:disulfide interchange protein DsbC
MKSLGLRLAVLLLGPTVPYASSHAVPGAYVAIPPDRAQAAATVELLSAIPRQERIVLEATAPVKHRITVITDVDCPYCRKLHAQAEQYRQAGIELQYLFFPRAGRESPAFAKAVAVWCGNDRTAALTLALAGGALPQRSCDNPVARHYEFAVRLGLLGTPALVTEDGEVIYGVPPVSKLLERRGTGQ